MGRVSAEALREAQGRGRSDRRRVFLSRETARVTLYLPVPHQSPQTPCHQHACGEHQRP